MDDPRLLTIAAAVERGEPVLPMGMLAGGWLVRGTPVAYATFYEQSSQNIARQLHAAMSRADQRQWEGRDAELWAHLRPQIGRAMSSLGDPSVRDGLALNMAPARADLKGTSVHMPAVRVPISTISAWWVTDLTAENVSSSAVGFGIAVPFN